MKKLYLLLLGAFLPVSVFAADVVSLSIDSQEAFDSWTSIDDNTDGTTWYYDGSVNGARYDYDRYNAANDWLISPDVEMQAGKVYEITGYVQIPKSMSESFLFTIGRGRTVEDQTTVILPEQSVSSVSSYRAYATTFSPEESGTYNIAIKATSPKNHYYIYFQKFEVKEKLEYPGMPVDTEVTPGDNGALSATLKWTWPQVSSDNAPLTTGITGAKVYRTNSSWVTVGDNICIADISGDNFVPGGQYEYVDTEVPEKGNFYY
ncbi:MAG: choice-of-anchor J domain-containing protein, partial [Muribaculum sp.]|nr:choice-of-anchor J domain-containing protein [Muribaculum sp.]